MCSMHYMIQFNSKLAKSRASEQDAMVTPFHQIYQTCTTISELGETNFTNKSIFTFLYVNICLMAIHNRQQPRDYWLSCRNGKLYSFTLMIFVMKRLSYDHLILHNWNHFSVSSLTNRSDFSFNSPWHIWEKPDEKNTYWLHTIESITHSKRMSKFSNNSKLI